MERSEVVFIGHGSPMNVLLDNQYTRNWRALSTQLKRPKAILAVSAHWYTDRCAISDKDYHKQIYDMYGFPDEIYKIEYNAKSDKTLEKRVIDLLGSDVEINNDWGLDHGLWSVLKFMYPEADIPLVIISIDATKTPMEHYDIARKLRDLRKEGYLILTSGNIVHNLRTVEWDNKGMNPVCEAFDDMVMEKIKTREYLDLVEYRKLENSSIAFHTPDHYIPLIYALGFLYGDEQTYAFNRGGELGTISMTSYIWK